MKPQANCGDFANETEILVAIYNSPKWNLKDVFEWDKADKADFPGIQINNDVVISLVLRGKSIIGEIPEELFCLTSLKRIDFGTNQLSGDIPNLFGNLPLLVQLFLNNNQLTGGIPNSLDGLHKISKIILNDNLLEGEVPNIFQNMPALGELRLNNNHFDGFEENFNFLGNPIKLHLEFNNLTFEDFTNAVITELEKATTTTYPQNEFQLLPDKVSVIEGQPFEIEAGIDLNLTDNQYQWYKDGKELFIENNGVFNIEKVKEEDGGIYFVNVTNPNPNLQNDFIIGSTEVELEVLPNCDNDDKVTLKAVYDKSDGANWKNPWKINANLATLEGVKTLPSSECVTSLKIVERGMTGTIPDEIGALSQLIELTITRERGVIGAIPNSLANLANLKKFIITHNDIKEFQPGFIFPESLEEIIFKDNEFKELPALDDLVNLVTLNVSNNNLEVLPDMTDLNNLVTLNVSNNKLTFEDIINLQDQLPYGFDILAAVSPQDTIGTPTSELKAIGEVFNIIANIEDQASINNIFQWYKDDEIILTETRQKLEIQNLQTEHSGYYVCQITNHAIPGLKLYTHPVRLSVTASCEKKVFPALEKLAINTDYLNWQYIDDTKKWDLLPENIANWEGVTLDGDCVVELNLENKKLINEDPLPENIWVDLSELKYLNISKNEELIGPIPSDIGVLTYLDSLDLADNKFSEGIPASFKDLKDLKKLDLSGNELLGEIPSQLGDLTDLIELNLSNQGVDSGISGDIPDEIGNLANLETLLLSQNKLKSIPNSIKNLGNLKILEVRGNNLEGEINTGIGELANLEMLDLSNNNLEGKIPESFGNLTKLTTLKLFGNKLTGKVPDGIGQLPNLKKLILGNNELDELPVFDPAFFSDFEVSITVEDNKLTFEDLLPNAGLLDDYSDQDSVGTEKTEVVTLGTSFTIDLVVDANVTTNSYEWYKDGVFVTSSTENKLKLQRIQSSDLGTYHAKITNDELNDLTLYTRGITLSLEDDLGEDDGLAILGDALVCSDASFLDYTVNQEGTNYSWDPLPGSVGIVIRTSSDTRTIYIQWSGAPEANIKVTNNDTQETASLDIKITGEYDSPSIEGHPDNVVTVVKGDPIGIITALGAPGANFKWHYQDYGNNGVIFTGPSFSPTEDGKPFDVTFSSDNTGTYALGLQQFNPDGTTTQCESGITKVVLRIAELTLLAPNGLTATQEGVNNAKLNWNYNILGKEDSVYIERSDGDAENFISIASIGVSELKEFVDTTPLETEITYYYRIRVIAVEDEEISPYSNIAFIKMNEGNGSENNIPNIADFNKKGEANDSLKFQLRDFNVWFTDEDEGDKLELIKIESLPVNGQLFLGNNVVVQGQEILAEEINSLFFFPDEDWTGQTSFDFKASDGKDFSLSTGTANITIELATNVLLPDFIGQSVEGATARKVKAGETINYLVNISNIGQGDGAVSSIRYFISKDAEPEIKNDDVPVSEQTIQALASGEERSETSTAIIPETLAPGIYFIKGLIDPNNDQDEEDEENNLIIISIIIQGEAIPVTIMNIVTPNGDGINEELIIENIDLFPSNQVKVLNKWGVEVFTTTNYNNTWSATDFDGKPLPSGSYICVLLYEEEEGQKRISEVVSIVRE